MRRALTALTERPPALLEALGWRARSARLVARVLVTEMDPGAACSVRAGERQRRRFDQLTPGRAVTERDQTPAGGRRARER